MKRQRKYTKLRKKVAETLSGTVTPQGIFAIIEKPQVDVTAAKQVLILDRIQDPGNLGTMIRTADAAGLDLIVMTKGTADVYQDKVLRASQGSVFHIPIQYVDDMSAWMSSFKGPIYGLRSKMQRRIIKSLANKIHLHSSSAMKGRCRDGFISAYDTKLDYSNLWTS